MTLIPAIDIIDGKCVRLTQGDYSQQKTYNDDPVETAKMFQDCGIKRLHVVDLDGARSGHIVNSKALEKIVAATSLTVDFGGGLKSDQDIAIAFDCGAAMVTGGSIAVNQPNTFERWINHFGADRIILGADARNGKISVSGWQQTTDTDLITFIKQWHTKGINKVICTDISRDGMLIGAANELYRQILTAIPDIYLIASGGVGSMRDIEDLSYIVPAVIFGKAFYENKITKRDIINYLRP